MPTPARRSIDAIIIVPEPELPVAGRPAGGFVGVGADAGTVTENDETLVPQVLVPVNVPAVAGAVKVAAAAPLAVLTVCVEP